MSSPSLFVLLALFAVSELVAQSAALQLHVATNGNDGWSGRLAKPNRDFSDGPLASLNGARDRLRERPHSEAVIVEVRGGTYRMDAPFVLEPRDSGTADAPVTYAAAPDERPIFSGGRVISGFKKNGPLWQTTIPQVREGRWYFRQLWVNGERRQLARSPNDGYFRIARLIPGPAIPNAKPVARDRFVFAPGDLRAYERLPDAHLVLMHSWENSIHPLRSINTISNIVTFAPLKEWWSVGYWEDSQRYFVEDAFELLDQPGEWHLDRESGVLSYWPMRGERMDKVEVVAPALTEFVRLAGDADKGELVRHVTLRGLTFHHADWVLDPKGNSSTQAAVETPAVITADGAIHCAIERCEVAHVGAYGIWFRRGCKDGLIQQNRLFDLGAGGIRVGEAKMARTDAAESSRIVVDNNHLFDGGKIYPGCVGIWLAQASHNRISHNDIHDFNYTGISVGWNWGLDPNRTSNNVIEFNHVHDLGHGVTSDCGLIYCLGVSPGGVIRNNVFHDIWPYSKPSFGWGIYLDAQCGNYLVESNLVYNTQSGGLMFNNGGHEHVIQNNIFALSASEALWPYSEKRPNTFRRNIVFLTQGKLLVPYGERSLNERIAAKDSPGVWDDNVYWHTDGADALQFYRKTFAEWQSIGLDPHSRIADPQFTNPRKGDFRLKPNSPALALGFQPIDISRVGLYGEKKWIGEVSHSRCRIKPLPAPPAQAKPLTFVDEFEDAQPNAHPTHAKVSGEEHGASVRITAERAASGRHSLKISDSKELKPTWQPHFYYEPNLKTGVVRQAFDVWITTNAQFFTEWRDAASLQQNVGPSVRFDGDGRVTVDGKLLTRIPAQQWVRVEIEARLGKDAPRLFQLAIKKPGSKVDVFRDLPFSGKNFRDLLWLGFSSTAASDTEFFLDNVAITTR